MIRWPASLRVRLTLWFTLVLGAPLIAFAFGSYTIFARTLRNRTDHFVGDALTAFSRELTAEGRMSLAPTAAARRTVAEVRFRDLQIIILDSAGAVVARGEEAQDPSGVDAQFRLDDRRLDAALHAMPWTATTLTIPDARGGYRLHSRPIVLDGTPMRITAVYPLHDVDAVLERIRGLFVIAIPLFLVSAAVGGYFVARRGLAPVADMAAHAATISASTLHERLPVSTPGDELGGLATVVNDLLDRLERAFTQQRRFMADASHELRTPTAILRTEADVTLSRPTRPEEEYRASFGVVQDASRRLTRIVEDLFLLARSDAGHLVVHLEDLYFEEVVLDAVRGIRPIAEQRLVRVEIDGEVEAPVRGDQDLLGRLVLNLLDNAVKFAPVDSVVHVALARDGANVTVIVTDAGPGIPPDVQSRIFERFFRVDAARSRHEASVTSGAGLGLAIARRVAETHGGRLELIESRPGHTAFRATIPASAPNLPG